MTAKFFALSIALLSFSQSALGADIYYRTHKDGWTWMYIVGRIEPGDDVKFKTELKRALDNDIMISSVAIYSQGGSVAPAINIGRYIRALNIATIAPYTLREPKGVNIRRFDQATIDLAVNTQHCPVYNGGNDVGMKLNIRTKRGDQNCICASACVLIWISGVGADFHNKSVLPKLLVHRISFDTGMYGELAPLVAKEKYEAAQREVEAYMKEMGTPESVIRRMFTVPSTEVSYLTDAELDMMRGALPPYLDELYRARCDKSQPCRDRLERQMYFESARKLFK